MAINIDIKEEQAKSQKVIEEQGLRVLPLQIIVFFG